MAYTRIRSVLPQVIGFPNSCRLLFKILNCEEDSQLYIQCNHQKELDSIFSEYGKPYLFRSDNGPCYTSEEFRIFIDEWKIEHRTSSPHYPQANGLAESMVKVLKHLIDKATLQGLTWNRLLLDYRCTSISSSIPSPAEILFSRKFRSELMLPSQVINPHKKQPERNDCQERR